MITRCRHCKGAFWRYRRDHPPPGYCSIACHEKRHQHAAEPPPPEPHVIVRRMREHNRLIHDTDSPLLRWDCETCAGLEADYAASLEYHQRRLSAEMIAAGASA